MVKRFERFSCAISEIYRCWHKIAYDEMGKYGLRGPHVIYITALYRYSDGLNAKQLGQVCNRDKADISRAITLMEKKDIVYKTASGTGSYRARISLTQEGRAMAERIIGKVMQAVEVGGKGLDEEQREVFYEVLDLIAENLREISENGLPSEKAE